ncbi:MAG: hypothetical protein KGI79_00390 [Patescibacteria group bacterium]|nr:hypothetical protein [Patescibacteria group bacterium]MDE2116326.1 hypothetical protein [Patescibacteria group bacterium]
MDQNGQSARQPRFLKWSLVFAIALVANLFVNYALSLAYKAPVWNDFCHDQQIVTPPATEAACVSAGGQWTAVVAPAGQEPPTVKTASGYCNPNYTCQQALQNAQESYERNVFIILVIVGVIMIALGSFVGGGEVVKTSLSFAGSLSLVVASFRYWSSAQDWLKVVILGVALAALLWLAVKKFARTDEKVRS